MATIRNLKIKTSTCKRIVKELDSYEKEVEREAAKTASMKDAGADPYDIKQQVWDFFTFFVPYTFPSTKTYFQVSTQKKIKLRKAKRVIELYILRAFLNFLIGSVFS